MFFIHGPHTDSQKKGNCSKYEETEAQGAEIT